MLVIAVNKRKPGLKVKDVQWLAQVSQSAGEEESLFSSAPGGLVD